jgi:hypothetical protein
MCFPIDKVNAMTAAQTAATMWASRSQAKAGAQQAGLFVDAARSNYDAISARGRQVRGKIKQEMGERAEQSSKELGRINAVLADSNLVGASSDRLRREVLFNESRDIAVLQENAFQASEQTRREMDAVRVDTRSRIAGIQAPSAIGSSLSVLSTAMTNKGPSLGDLWDTTRSYFKKD